MYSNVDAFYFRRVLTGAFSPIIRLDDPELDVDKAVREHYLFHNAIRSFSERKISGDEFLDLVENVIPDMDDYLDEVEENLAEIGLNSE